MKGLNYSVNEVCDIFDVSARTIIRYAENRRIVGAFQICPGGQWRFPKEQINDLYRDAQENGQVFSERLKAVNGIR